jgi:hypothetical protein
MPVNAPPPLNLRGVSRARGRRLLPRYLVAVAAITAALLAAACGDVAHPGGPPPTPTEPVLVNAENVPGAAGFALGPYTPTSDVTFEVRTNAAIEQIAGFLADPFPDWDAVRESFEAAPAPVGEITPPSLAAVTATAATGPLGGVYTGYFGAPDWLHARALDAIGGTGDFAQRSDTERAATLNQLFAIELPINRALFAAEATERLTAEGDVDLRFGAPHEWDRLWAILQGSPALAPLLTDDLVDTILRGQAASAAGDTAAMSEAHDAVRAALLTAALEEIAGLAPSALPGSAVAINVSLEDRARATAYLRAVEPLLARVDRNATTRLSDLLAGDGPPDLDAISARAATLAAHAGLEPLVAAEPQN